MFWACFGRKKKARVPASTKLPLLFYLRGETTNQIISGFASCNLVTVAQCVQLMISVAVNSTNTWCIHCLHEIVLCWFTRLDLSPCWGHELPNVITVYREIFAVKIFSWLSVTAKITHTKFFQQRNTAIVFLIQEVRCRPKYHPRQLLQQIEKWKNWSHPYCI